MVFSAEERESTPYLKKVVRSPTYKPSVSHMGGKASDGWVAVTATGLVGARWHNVCPDWFES